MKIRILDRVVAAIVGLILIALCAGIVAQLVFGVDVIGPVSRVLTTQNLVYQILLAVGTLLLLALGVYCFMLLCRHKRKRDQFIQQATDDGELAISLKALENMITKCLEQHPEMNVQSVQLENDRDGLVVLIRGNVAGGISIPLTVDAIQKQIKQYVTACSGVEVRNIRVEIETSGPDAPDATFAIAAPAPQPLLRSAEEKGSESVSAEPVPVQVPAENAAETVPPQPVQETVAAPVMPEFPPEDEEDDRPIHQRLFSHRPEPCNMPPPPAELMNEEPAEGTEQEANTASPAEEQPKTAAAEPENTEPEDAAVPAEEKPAEPVEKEEPAVTAVPDEMTAEEPETDGKIPEEKPDDFRLDLYDFVVPKDFETDQEGADAATEEPAKKDETPGQPETSSDNLPAEEAEEK